MEKKDFPGSVRPSNPLLPARIVGNVEVMIPKIKKETESDGDLEQQTVKSSSDVQPLTIKTEAEDNGYDLQKQAQKVPPCYDSDIEILDEVSNSSTIPEAMNIEEGCLLSAETDQVFTSFRSLLKAEPPDTGQPELISSTIEPGIQSVHLNSILSSVQKIIKQEPTDREDYTADINHQEMVSFVPESRMSMQGDITPPDNFTNRIIKQEPIDIEDDNEIFIPTPAEPADIDRSGMSVQVDTAQCETPSGSFINKNIKQEPMGEGEEADPKHEIFLPKEFEASTIENTCSNFDKVPENLEKLDLNLNSNEIPEETFLSDLLQFCEENDPNEVNETIEFLGSLDSWNVQEDRYALFYRDEINVTPEQPATFIQMPDSQMNVRKEINTVVGSSVTIRNISDKFPIQKVQSPPISNGNFLRMSETKSRNKIRAKEISVTPNCPPVKNCQKLSKENISGPSSLSSKTQTSCTEQVNHIVNTNTELPSNEQLQAMLKNVTSMGSPSTSDDSSGQQENRNANSSYSFHNAERFSDANSLISPFYAEKVQNDQYKIATDAVDRRNVGHMQSDSVTIVSTPTQHEPETKNAAFKCLSVPNPDSSYGTTDSLVNQLFAKSSQPINDDTKHKIAENATARRNFGFQQSERVPVMNEINSVTEYFKTFSPPTQFQSNVTDNLGKRKCLNPEDDSKKRKISSLNPNAQLTRSFGHFQIKSPPVVPEKNLQNQNPPFEPVLHVRDPRLKKLSQLPNNLPGIKFQPRKGTKVDLSTINFKNIGNRSHADEFPTFVLQWNPSWMELQRQTGQFPEICTSYLPVRSVYDDDSQYFNTYARFHMIDFWFKMCFENDRNRFYGAKYEDEKTGRDGNRVTCSIVLNHADVSNVQPKRDDIVLCRVKVPDSTVEVFGRVMCVFIKKLGSNEENLSKFKIDFLCVEKLVDPKFKDFAKLEIKILSNIRLAVQQNDALCYLPGHLKNLILDPVSHKGNICIVQPQREQNLKFLRDTVVESLETHRAVLIDTSNLQETEVDTLVRLLAYKLWNSVMHDILVCLKNPDSFRSLVNAQSGYDPKPILAVRSKEVNLTENQLNMTLEKRLAEKKQKVAEIYNTAPRCPITLSLFSALSLKECKQVFSKKGVCVILEGADCCTEFETALPLMYNAQTMVLLGKPTGEATVHPFLKQYGYNRSLFSRLFRAKQSI